MEQRRILFVIDEIWSTSSGGTERQLAQMVKLATKNGYHAEVAVLRNPVIEVEKQLGCTVHDCGLSKIFSMSGTLSMFRFWRWLHQRRFHVVRTFFVDANLIVPVIARLAGVPVVIGSRRNTNSWMSNRRGALQRFSNLFATRIVANCTQVKQAVIRTEKSPAAKIDVIYNGIDLLPFESVTGRRQRVRKKLGIRDDAILIGNLSRLDKIKGVDTFVKAAALVHRELPSVVFVAVGEGGERQRLEQMIASSGLASSFFLPGNSTDVAGYLEAFDVAVLSSNAEGFSNSILEYMAAGLPTIATDVGGNSEALGNCGVLVRVGDHEALAKEITALVEDEPRRRLLGEAAKKRAQQEFDISGIEVELRNYYERLLAETTK
ncbi:MAG: glycosyl transferase group 1 [Acidobacteriales bacterium]|nr:glycosyl transferase group 1 [Terriglobales bacterium]